MDRVKFFLINARIEVRSFLRGHPALEMALLFIFSIALYLKVSSVIILVGIFIGIVGIKRALLFALPIMLSLGLFLYWHYGGEVPKEDLEGRGKIEIQKVTYSAGFFGSSWVYTGVIKNFICAKKSYRNLPFTLHRKSKLGPLDALYDYEIEGILKKKDTYGYALKVAPDAQFIKSSQNWGIAEKRYQLKKSFKTFIKKRIPYRSAREFLIGISTGDFSNSFLSFTFSRFGLNHLLAISGFHFGLLLLFLNVLLSSFLPLKLKTVLLILGLTGFYFFVGDTPSLSRAWIASLVYLIGILLDKKAKPVNTLSLALCVVIIMDPLMITHLGFQFSFLVTYAILLYFGKVESVLKEHFKPGNKFERGFVSAIALGISVHIGALPLTLFYFHKFYLLGFVFNLFIPIIVGACVFVLLSALFIHLLVPFIAKYLFLFSGYCTEFLLKFIFWIPTSFDYCIRVPTFSFSFLLFYLTLFFLIGARVLREDVSFEKLIFVEKK